MCFLAPLDVLGKPALLEYFSFTAIVALTALIL